MLCGGSQNVPLAYQALKDLRMNFETTDEPRKCLPADFGGASWLAQVGSLISQSPVCLWWLCCCCALVGILTLTFSGSTVDRSTARQGASLFPLKPTVSFHLHCYHHVPPVAWPLWNCWPWQPLSSRHLASYTIASPTGVAKLRWPPSCQAAQRSKKGEGKLTPSVTQLSDQSTPS